MARSSSYNKTLGRKICDRIAAGETLRQIVLDPEMPCKATPCNWRRENAAFRAMYIDAYQESSFPLEEDAEHALRMMDPTYAAQFDQNPNDGYHAMVQSSGLLRLAELRRPKDYLEEAAKEEPDPIVVYQIPDNGRVIPGLKVITAALPEPEDDADKG